MDVRLEQDRNDCGKEFHTVGAANEKLRLPIEVRISGITRRLVTEERSLREGSVAYPGFFRGGQKFFSKNF